MLVGAAPHKAFAVLPDNDMPNRQSIDCETRAAGQQKAQYPAFRFDDPGRKGDFSSGYDDKRNHQDADAGYRQSPTVSEK